MRLCSLVEDLLEDPCLAPVHEAVGQHLVRIIGRWRILPLQAVLIDPADHSSIIHTGMPCETGKYDSILFNCRRVNGNTSLMVTSKQSESQLDSRGKTKTS